MTTVPKSVQFGSSEMISRSDGSRELSTGILPSPPSDRSVVSMAVDLPMPLGPSITTPRPGVLLAMVNRSVWLGTTKLCSGMPWILKTCSRRGDAFVASHICSTASPTRSSARGDLRSADRGTSGVPPPKLGQANGLNALVRYGADDGNRTRVFSLGS